MNEAAPARVDRPRWRRYARRVGFALGLALLVAAIVVVVREQETFRAALAALRRPAPGALALLFVGVVGNLLGSVLFLTLLLRRYGHVGLREMTAVVSAATLLNYLPLRPGLFGRLAYHKTVNDIDVRDGVRTIIQQVVVSGIVAVTLIGLMRAVTWFDVRAEPVLAVALATPALAGLVLARLKAEAAGVFAAAGAIRGVEFLVWGWRYQAAFALLGHDLALAPAVTLAALAALASLVPFVSNGIGLREWAVGLATPVLASMTLEVGMTAELVNRAAELVVVVPAGVVGLWWVARQRRTAQ